MERPGARAESERADRGSRAPKQLYLANADEPAIQAGDDVLLASLRILAPRGLRWTYEPMPGEHHSTIFPFAALRGIRTVFAP